MAVGTWSCCAIGNLGRKDWFRQDPGAADDRWDSNPQPLAGHLISRNSPDAKNPGNPVDSESIIGIESPIFYPIPDRNPDQRKTRRGLRQFIITACSCVLNEEPTSSLDRSIARSLDRIALRFPLRTRHARCLRIARIPIRIHVRPATKNGRFLPEFGPWSPATPATRKARRLSKSRRKSRMSRPDYHNVS